jgi:hypothetical protein
MAVTTVEIKEQWQADEANRSPEERGPGAIHDHKWSGKDPIAALHRVLVASGHSEVPSQDTLPRLVDHLHSEIGEAGLLRITRVRREQT